MKQKNDNTRQDGFRHRILYALLGLGIGGAFADKAREWLADDEQREQKDEALLDVAERLYPSRVTATRQALKSLLQLKKRLGMPEAKYTVRGGVVEIPEYLRAAKTAVPVVKLRRPMWVRVAAVLIPVLVIGGAMSILMNRVTTFPNQAATHYVVATAENGEREMALPDGSQVRILNGHIEYAEDFKSNRNVKIYGEAYFSVTKNEARPFTVETGDMQVTVFGTEFSVRSVEGDSKAEVILVEGSVRVISAGVGDVVVMRPGQRYVYDKQKRTAALTEVTRADLMRLKGVPLEFRNKSVEEILRGVGDYYGVTMSIGDGVVFDNDLVVDLSGNESLDDVLSLLRDVTNNFDYKIIQDTVYISK